LLSCEAVGGRLTDAIHAGAAVELMHNFTLVHDDIMDEAPSRRGRPSVHAHWDVNNALLVGDVLLGLAYRSLLKTRSKQIQRITDLFTTALLEVCEGQARDVEFEHRDDVDLQDYIGMIGKKTGGLISMSTELGGLIGHGTSRHVKALRAFGRHLGRAFQIQDDLLDVVAEEKKLGKAIGGDIVVGKKTFLLLTALERASGKDKTILQSVMKRRPPEDARQHIVDTVTAIYRRYGVIEESVQKIQRSTDNATAALEELPGNRATEMLRWFSEQLVKRVS
jgi:geranylgeranyl diphosphate synthase type II